MTELLCDYQDQACQERVRQALIQRPFELVRHWEEPGIAIWEYELESERLQVSKEYGEMYVKGSAGLKNWLLSEVRRA